LLITFTHLRQHATLPLARMSDMETRAQHDTPARTTPEPGIKLPCCQVHACPCWPHPSTPLSPASSTNSQFCKGALGQVFQPALCNSRVRSKVQLSLVTWMATGKHQQVKCVRALSCVAATAMEGCSYIFHAEPIKKLQQKRHRVG